MAPRTGDTAAFRSTDTLTAAVNQNVPSRSPRNRMVHRLMAKLTIANEKIVFAKSYRAHARPCEALPDCVQPPRPRHHAPGARTVTDAIAARSRPDHTGANVAASQAAAARRLAVRMG
jgi:hypothetical protein